MLHLSIVIPCRNEEKYIARCLDALLRQEDVTLDREIIVVDNGSTDDTLKILERYVPRIRWYACPGLTIPGLRNFGVEKSTKEWIAFVDADVEVDRHWAKALSEFVEECGRNGMDTKRLITGSTCLVPENPGWVERIWYEQLILRDKESAKYINAGNLVVHREMFGRVGGFDTSYRTGEEERLCEEARLRHGAIILKNDRMRAVHHGYPKSIGAFFQRMRWHGRGMSRYLMKPWRSRPLQLAMYYVILTAGYLFMIWDGRNYYFSTVAYILLQVAPALLYAARRYRGGVKQVSLLTFLYICFGWARVVSLFDMAVRREVLQKK